MSARIRVLKKEGRPTVGSSSSSSRNNDSRDESADSDKKPQALIKELGLDKLRLSDEAKSFKLIEEQEWNIVKSEPANEASFFSDGYSAMSIVSVIGPEGVGKSSLLNTIARKEVFKTHRGRMTAKHLTRGIDIYSTYYRILMDCQPILSASVLEDFVSGQSCSQFMRNSSISNPVTSCFMISIQLATFLIASSDYVIIKVNWLVDSQLLKVISTAMMMIGFENIKAKVVLFCEDEKIHDVKFKQVLDRCLGYNVISGYFSDEDELIEFVAPYTEDKCEKYRSDPSKFSGKNWLNSCQRIWTSTIKDSSLFASYATQVYPSNQHID